MLRAEAAVVAPGRDRWRLALVLGITLLVGYYDRLNVSFAIPLLALERGWTPEETETYGGSLMSLFYVGYGLANIFLSPVAARFGPRRSLAFMVILWSLFTALSAWVSASLVAFYATRVLLGLAEGVHFPMMNQLTQRWFPLRERSRANGVWISGLFLAVLTAPLVLVPLMNALGWRAGFVVLAAAGLLVSLPLVLRYVYDSPGTHPRLGDEERAALVDAAARDLATAPETTADAATLRRLATSRPFLMMLAAGILNNVVSLGISGWLPTYLTAKLGVPYASLSFFAALPYAFSLLGVAVWAVVGDRTGARARNAALGYFATGLLVYAALSVGAFVPTLALFSLATFTIATFNACEFAMMQRILPPVRIAAAVGLYNGLSTMIGGGLGPFVVGGILSGSSGASASVPLVVVCTLNALALYALARSTRY